MRSLEVEDDYDDEEDEFKGFLPGSPRRDYEGGDDDVDNLRNGNYNLGRRPSSRAARWGGILSTVLCLIGLLYILQRSHDNKASSSNRHHSSSGSGNGGTRNSPNNNDTSIEPNEHDDRQPAAPRKNQTSVYAKEPVEEAASADPSLSSLLFTCPKSSVSPAENIATAQTEHELWYESVSRGMNVTAYIETFRETEYDNWGHSFTEVKHAMFRWKSNMYSDVQTGDYIFESACGIGMNLFMTLEILNKVHKVTNITVFGNEYMAQSVDIARTMFGRNGWLPARGRYGSICTADSTNLTFVPSHTFDLVYTGYISPLFDPLHLNLGSTNANFAVYTADCEGKDGKLSNSRRAAAQQRQNDWYGAWVGEMVRIAKPGAPVIVEQVSYPLCNAIFDWGGVAPEFWKKAIKRYGWDIDPTSIEMEDDVLFTRRYHVFMRKNGDNER